MNTEQLNKIAQSTLSLIRDNPSITDSDGVEIQLRVILSDEQREKMKSRFSKEQQKKLKEIYRKTDDIQMVDSVLYYCFSRAYHAEQGEDNSKEAEKIIELLYQSPADEPDIFRKKQLNFFNAPIVNVLNDADSREIVPSRYNNSGELLRKTKKAEAKIVIENVSELANGKSNSILRTSAMKLLDACIALLSAHNYYRTGSLINPCVMLDVAEYARACGESITPLNDSEQELKRAKKAKQYFVEKIYTDLNSLCSVDISGTEHRGNKTVDLKIKRDLKNSRFGLISSYQSHLRTSGKIQINFDYQTAEYLVHGYVSQYPVDLLKVDNKHPYTYALGKKLTAQYMNDNNFVKGTNNSLKMLTVLEAVPDFSTSEEHGTTIETENRHTKGRTIKKFEESMKELEKLGIVSRWEYRTVTGKTFPRSVAAKMLMQDYENLILDFSMCTEIDTTDKLKRIEEKTKRTKKK